MLSNVHRLLLIVLFMLLQATTGAAQEAKPYGYFSFNTESATLSFNARDFEMSGPVTFHVSEVWSYSSSDDRWSIVPIEAAPDKTISKRPRQVYGGVTDPEVRRLTKGLWGLFWVKWVENGHELEQFAYAGMMCNDVMIGPPRKGDRVAVCVPDRSSATAQYVPDPRIFCIAPHQ